MPPKVKAVVAVVQTTTERDHSSEAGQEAYLGLEDCMPWIEFRFYDEHSIDQCYRDVQDGIFSSLVFASNSLSNPLINDASERAARVIQRQSHRGMGIVILQQFLSQGTTRECLFLPIKHQVTFRAISPLTIESLDVNDRTWHVREGTKFTGVLDDFTVRAPTLWSLAEPQLTSEWSPIAWAHTDEGVKTVIQRSRSPRARTIVSAIPLDWLERRDLLANLVARSVMFNGTLYVHPEGRGDTDAVSVRVVLGRASQSGRHLTSHEIASPSEINVAGYPYRHFNHLLLHPAWGWSDISKDLRLALRRRLENDGSVTACADSAVTGVPMMVTVGGKPAYRQLADRFALYMASGETIHDTPAPPIRALAALAAAVNTACEHNDAVPRVLNYDDLKKRLTPHFERRLRDGTDNVDREAMPTAAMASAMRLVGMEPSASDPLVRWLESGKYRANPAALRQAKVWLPDLRLPDLPPPGTVVDELYDRLATCLSSPEPELDLSWFTTRLLEDRSDTVSHRAIIAEALTASGRADAIAAVALAARSLHDDLERAYSQPHPAMELLALLTAALIRVHKEAGLGVDLSGLVMEDGPEADAPETGETLNEALHRERDERVRLEAIHQQQQSALREEQLRLEARHNEQLGALGEAKSRAQGLSRTLIGVLTVALWAIVSAAAVLIYLLFLDHGLEHGVTVAGIAGVVLGASVQVIGKQSAKLDCEPAFLTAIRFWRES